MADGELPATSGRVTNGNEAAQGHDQKSPVTLNAPNPAVKYGGINPEIEENVENVRSLPGPVLRRDAEDCRTMRAASYQGKHQAGTHNSSFGDADSHGPSIPSTSPTVRNGSAAFLNLPSELIAAIFSYLSPLELAKVSPVCRRFHGHADSDIHWKEHVLANLPGHDVKSPYPCRTWRELYIAHDPLWFLTKHKVWFCDREMTGQMVIVRYDERRGCIEGYQLPWQADPNVHIHRFEPRVRLHLDKPILQFNARVTNLDHEGATTSRLPITSRSRRFFTEQPLCHSYGNDPRMSNFLLARALPPSALNSMATAFPYDSIWPPPSIPARQRVLGQPAIFGAQGTRGFYDCTASDTWRPADRSEVSDQTFRIRQWLEMGPPTLGYHTAEEVITYSTLDPSLYTPTPDKPWRGIWVGDYSGHGCEFLLMNQPDTSEGEADEPLEKWQGESEASFRERHLRERVHRGRLEAIKLTGDPNVPRGEYTFIADDLGAGGYVGIAEQAPFAGARVVKSRGHIASLGFRRDKYIASQLILISHNRLAQYWVEFGHISFFERVDINQFLYIIRVTAGPDYDIDKHVEVPVNTPDLVKISSDLMDAELNVRVQDYRGLPRNSPSTSPYFAVPPHDANGDQYSIAIRFTPKKPPPPPSSASSGKGENEEGKVQDKDKDKDKEEDGEDAPGISGQDLQFGNDFDHAIRDKLPPGFGAAMWLVKRFIDPGLEGDPAADTPYLYGPALSSFNRVHAGPATYEPEKGGLLVEEGGDEAGLRRRREVGVPENDPQARKDWALTPGNNKKWTFAWGETVALDFFNPYLDFNTFSLKLPGFWGWKGYNIPIMDYWDGQPLRYVLRNRRGGPDGNGFPYLVLLFTLYLKEDVNEDGSLKPAALQATRQDKALAAGSGKVEVGGEEEKELDEARRQVERLDLEGKDAGVD
ncbi:f-box domain-containing protein [Xylariomycetidae sp. FL0641]|nr:f-box domain-containing protein [Xylariomycetidae sp. FL0641]